MTIRAAVAGVALATSALVGAQTPTAATAEALAAAIERELKAARVPGASFAVTSGVESVVRSYGLADVPADAPMRRETLLQVGSLNKVMTALALATTLQQQRIAFDEPIGKHIPNLTPRLAAVTFHQLLSQTAGLRDEAGANGTNDESALEKRVRAIGERDFVLPAGTVFSYSNLGYATAGYALQHLRKRPYADALADAMLRPLEMQRTTMRPDDASRNPRAAGHRFEGGDAIAIRDFDNDTSLWPAGYLWTTASELLPVLRALSNVGGAPAALPPSLLARVTSPHTPMPNIFVGGHYGYGLMVANVQGISIYEHGGTQRGFSSILRAAPGERVGVLILTNLDNAPLRNTAQKVMAEALHVKNIPAVERTETSVPPMEMSGLIGVYRNRGTAEIAVRDGRVVLILDGSPPMPVTRVDNRRYVARTRPGPGGLEFVLQPATATVPPYLHFALWAYVRTGS
jgi:CubicO group peptidase (beta-lactamase class C family)